MIQSVDRALGILCLFSRNVRELGVTEIGQHMDLPKSTVHGLVKTLEKRGFLTQNPQNGKYRLGLKVYELGMTYSAAVELQDVAKHVAEKLCDKCQESVHMAIYAGGMAVFILKVEPMGNLVVFPRVGASVPAHATGVGKVLLAYSEEEEVNKYVERGLFALTRNTITDPMVLRAELKRVRDQGYAVDNEEALIGVSCVAAPIRDQSQGVVAALSLSGASYRIRGERFAALVKEVKEAADEISRMLGYWL